MRIVENLIKNKGLINTSRRLKIRNYLNKSLSKRGLFFLLKHKCILKRKNTEVGNLFYVEKKTKVQQKKAFFFLIKTTTMFIIFIFIESCRPLTSTQRFRRFTFLLKFKKIKKCFKLFFKNNSGRNNKGGLTLFSKGIKKKSYSTAITLNKWDNKLFVVSSLIRSKKKILSLCKHTCGSLSLQPNINGVFLGQYVFFSNLPQKYWKNNLPGNFVLLKFLTKYIVFSNIFIGGVRKYSTANGTFCQILDFFSEFNLIRFCLPSKKIKMLSGWNFVMLGRNAQIDHKYNIPGKAGSRILYGTKPKVRGVARNPVDHPHGGRTKTNQPEVSIWGWVAKKNK